MKLSLALSGASLLVARALAADVPPIVTKVRLAFPPL